MNQHQTPNQQSYSLKSSNSGVIVIGCIDFHRIHIGKRRVVRFSLANLNNNNKEIVVRNLYLQQPIQVENNSFRQNHHSGSSISSIGSFGGIFSIVGNIQFPISIGTNEEFQSLISFVPPHPGRFTALLTIILEGYPQPKLQQISVNGEGEIPSSPTQIIYTDNLPIIVETPFKKASSFQSFDSYNRGSSSNSSKSSKTTISTNSSDSWSSLPPFPLYFDEDIEDQSDNNQSQQQQQPSQHMHYKNSNKIETVTISPVQNSHEKKVRWSPFVAEKKFNDQERINVNQQNLKPHLIHDEDDSDGNEQQEQQEEEKEEEEEQEEYQQDSKHTFKIKDNLNYNNNDSNNISNGTSSNYYYNNQNITKSDKQQQEILVNNFSYSNDIINSKFQQLEKKLFDLTKRVEERYHSTNSQPTVNQHHHQYKMYNNNHKNQQYSGYKESPPLYGDSNEKKSKPQPTMVPITSTTAQVISKPTTPINSKNIKQQQYAVNITPNNREYIPGFNTKENLDLLREMESKTPRPKPETPASWKDFLKKDQGIDDSINNINFNRFDQTPFKNPKQAY
ncbi:centrosomal protein 75 kDa [Tieghemostelium lacteum]|uniref:Centrosomal protein 75 kDa n=1 Tax=Tieghemostelium lacteum TaxID=361077 RepID=A0A152A4U8_TIELA|nr:centrosomal protein 75 kDa [Tieghemostelium lacteum]|eukprot:KYR01263.1 centrosomal protein 75 kDa [Tieghemostelium lacteum]